MKRISSLITMAALVFATAGCLKDDGFDDHEFGMKETSNQPPGIVLPESANEINSRSIDNVTSSQVVLGPAVVLADDKIADKDIHVTLVIDDALRQKYNLENGTDLKPLPGSLYNIPSLTVTIPKGKSLDTLKVVVPNATLFDLTQKYGIGFTVASIQEPGYTIADNWKNFLMSVVIKNEYEGDYHSKGVFHHPTAGDRGIDEDKYLITYGATAVQANLGDLGGQGYTMILNINPDNTVTITKSGATPNVDQHWGPNFYDPATKSFHLHYSYNSAAPRIIEETITLK